MDIFEAWNKAAKGTEIIRSRIQPLSSHQDTNVPYCILSESTINEGDTVVRKGRVVVEKPSLILPPNIPQIEGFEVEEDFNSGDDEFINFLIVRGVTLPSLKYYNKTYSLDMFDGKLSKAVKHYKEQLQHQENVNTGLIVGPEDCWQLSLLIFVYSQIVKNADTDIKKLLDEHQKGRYN